MGARSIFAETCSQATVTASLVGADLSRPPPIMVINKISGTSVGADLSRPPPIYRPSVDVSIAGLFC